VTPDEVMHAADAALYCAKQTGRNKVCLACEVVLSDVLGEEKMPDPQDRNAILDTIYALAATIDAKDRHTCDHSEKVTKYAADIAEALGYSGKEIERIRTGALLHDIGKIGIPDQLLTKRGPLDDRDWELIKAHPNLGVAILGHVDSLRDCLAAVQYHHERYDGTGYPAGLKGKNIPLDARILAVADSYDAMTSERRHRAALPVGKAVEEIRRGAGTQFDPDAANALLRTVAAEFTTSGV